MNETVNKPGYKNVIIILMAALVIMVLIIAARPSYAIFTDASTTGTGTFRVKLPDSAGQDSVVSPEKVMTGTADNSDKNTSEGTEPEKETVSDQDHSRSVQETEPEKDQGKEVSDEKEEISEEASDETPAEISGGSASGSIQEDPSEEEVASESEPVDNAEEEELDAVAEQEPDEPSDIADAGNTAEGGDSDSEEADNAG